MTPIKIELSLEPRRVGLETRMFNTDIMGKLNRASDREYEAFWRKELGDFVNLLWPQFAHWSGMLWDPKRFPTMVYELNREDAPSMFKLAKEDEAICSGIPRGSRR